LEKEGLKAEDIREISGWFTRPFPNQELIQSLFPLPWKTVVYALQELAEKRKISINSPACSNARGI
jgi:hypothetical protein